VTVEEAKAKIFHWLCSRYHDPGKGNEYIDKDILREAISIPEEVFEKALKEFVDPGAHECVEVEMPTGRLRLEPPACDFAKQERIRSPRPIKGPPGEEVNRRRNKRPARCEATHR
jgi:hypothetical protein